MEGVLATVRNTAAFQDLGKGRLRSRKMSISKSMTTKRTAYINSNIQILSMKHSVSIISA